MNLKQSAKKILGMSYNKTIDRAKQESVLGRIEQMEEQLGFSLSQTDGWNRVTFRSDRGHYKYAIEPYSDVVMNASDDDDRLYLHIDSTEEWKTGRDDEQYKKVKPCLDRILELDLPGEYACETTPVLVEEENALFELPPSNPGVDKAIPFVFNEGVNPEQTWTIDLIESDYVAYNDAYQVVGQAVSEEESEFDEAVFTASKI